MLIKVEQLEDSALDWAVTYCENAFFGTGAYALEHFSVNTEMFDYTTNWARSGPIIERVGLNLRQCYTSGKPNKGEYAWKCDKDFHNNVMTLGAFTQYGPTPLVAAMRSYVASKLGDEVDIPDELISSQDELSDTQSDTQANRRLSP
jgi:hypothetical protein